MVFSFSDNQKIGLGLTVAGCLFTTLGVMMFFDRGLLALGNLLFLAGVTLLIGLTKTFQFFFQARKIKGSVSFFGGIALVLSGWTFIGMVVEAFGFLNLFGDFFPTILQFLRELPLIGTLLNLPGVSHVVDKIVRGGRLPV